MGADITSGQCCWLRFQFVVTKQPEIWARRWVPELTTFWTPRVQKWSQKWVPEANPQNHKMLAQLHSTPGPPSDAHIPKRTLVCNTTQTHQLHGTWTNTYGVGRGIHTFARFASIDILPEAGILPIRRPTRFLQREKNILFLGAARFLRDTLPPTPCVSATAPPCWSYCSATVVVRGARPRVSL